MSGLFHRASIGSVLGRRPGSGDGPGGPGALSGFSHIELSYVTTFYFNQTDSSSVVELLRRYASYSGDLLDRLQFVFVDDGSPTPVEPPADLELNLLLLRLPVDVPWNHAAARNLGAVCARSDKLLLTDVDHEFPEDTLRRIVALGPCGAPCTCSSGSTRAGPTRDGT